MPAQQGGGGAGAAVLAQLAQTTGLGALGGIAGGKSTDQLYVAMMRSQTIQDALIDKHGLRKKWETRSIEDARLKLTKNVAVAVEKQSGLIKITAEDPDPVFAAILANSHVEELQKMLDRVATTEARQRRVFYESQIAKTQTNLEQADMRYRLAQASSGIQVTSLLAESALRTSTELRSKITALEIQLQASSQFLTANNPDTQRAASELAALRARLKQLEQGSGQAVNNPTQQATVQAFRELKVQEAKLDAIVRQLELAKIDEAKEGVPVQIVDQAIPAERKSSPKRAIIVISAAALGLLIGLIVAAIRATFRNFQRDQENQARFHTFVRSWALRF
jgi:uncharacterized protein involved in exopolysaccharide biosynthesis